MSLEPLQIENTLDREATMRFMARPPRVIVQENHGIVTLGHSIEAVMAAIFDGGKSGWHLGLRGGVLRTSLHDPGTGRAHFNRLNPLTPHPASPMRWHGNIETVNDQIMP